MQWEPGTHRVDPVEDGEARLVLDQVLLGHAAGDGAALRHLLRHLRRRVHLCQPTCCGHS